MRVTNNITVTLDAYGNDTDGLLALIEDLPRGTKFNLAYHKGDRPFDADTFTMKFTYED